MIQLVLSPASCGTHSDCSGMPSIPIISSSLPCSPPSTVPDRAVLGKKLEGLSPFDVLCHVACLLGLSLRNSPTYHLSVHDFAVDICNQTLEAVHTGLRKTSLPQDLWPMLDSSGKFLLLWFFPNSLLGRRHNPAVEIVLGVIWACKALLWLRTKQYTPQAKKVLNLLPAGERYALTHGCELQHAWSLPFLESLVNKQRLLVNSFSTDFGLYQWFSSSWRYVGIGKLQRQSHDRQGGLTRRLFEHLQGAMRPRYREGYKLRYRLSRKTPLWSSMFLILSTGAEHFIRACEFVEIKLHSPNGNGVPLSCKRAKKKVRRRPPKHVRQSCQVPDFSFRDRLVEQKRKQLSQDQLLVPEPVQSLWDFPFKSAYCLQQKLVLQESGVLGPVNIFDPKHRCLFLLFLSSRKCNFSWRVAEAHDPDAAVKCAKQLRQLKKPHQRTAARRHLDPWLRARQLPSTRVRFVKVWDKSLVKFGQQFLVNYISSASCWRHRSRLVQQWAFSRFRFVFGKPEYFMDRWNHAKICKSCYPLPSHPEIPEVVSGTMKCVEKCWKTEVRYSSMTSETVALYEKIVAEVQSISGCSSAPSNFDDSRCYSDRLPAPPDMKKRWQKFRASEKEYQAFVADFLGHTGAAIIPDDKRKKFAWILNCSSYLFLMCSFAWMASTWTHQSMSPAEGNVWLCKMMLLILGNDLSKKLRINTNTDLLPYMYVTIKQKCWSGNLRVCKKPGHSCVRKIVSYSMWPARATWRSIHRAWDTILKHCGNTCDAWSLQDASLKLRGNIAMLVPNPNNRCRRCKVYFSSVSGVVADAGQFFEKVNRTEAIAEAQELLHIFTRSTKQTFVTVESQRKRIGWFGAPRFLHSYKRRTWSVEDLLRAFCAAMSVCLVSVCQAVFEMDGLPIGGLMSKCAACITLGGQERRWKSSSETRAREGYRSNCSWNRAVCHIRYIDDVILVSRLFCRQCLIDCLGVIYNVPFDVSDDDRILKWLDMSLDLNTCFVGLNIKPLALPPHWSVSKTFLRNILLGRFKRWSEIGPRPSEWQRALVRLLLDVRLTGWSSTYVSSALFSIHNIAFIPYVSFAQHVWNTIKKEVPPVKAH